MINWQQQIEAQIADLRRYSYQGEGDEISELVQSMHNAAAQLEALKDVAVAAEKVIVSAVGPEADRDYDALCDALDKLREVGDVHT